MTTPSVVVVMGVARPPPLPFLRGQLRGYATSADDSTQKNPPPAVVGGGGPAALDADDDTADTTSAAAAAEALLAEEAAAKATTTAKPPQPLFPWRHETSKNLLPRLVKGTPEWQYHVGFRARVQDFMAKKLLGVPWWHKWMGWDWRPERAESASYAFSQGVAGIVSNVYRIPFNDLITEEEESSGMRQTLDFRYPMPPLASPILPNVEIERSDAPSSPSPPDNATGVTGNRAHDRDDDCDSPPSPEDCCPGIDQMLDEPLRKLFQSAHEHGKNRLQIRLQMTPTSRRVVVSIFCLPFVTRQDAERDPALAGRVRDMFRGLLSTGERPISQINILEYTQERLAQDRANLRTTVELQVLVECDEIFQVVDRETGQVLQGSADGEVRRVWHLVCLETTSTFSPWLYFPLRGRVEVGNWIITDIDDLLGPKKWYHM